MKKEERDELVKEGKITKLNKNITINALGKDVFYQGTIKKIRIKSSLLIIFK